VPTGGHGLAGMRERVALFGGAGMDGIETTRRLPRHRILVLTTFGMDEYIVGALRAGASGFLLKDAAAEVHRSSRRRLLGPADPSPYDGDARRAHVGPRSAGGIDVGERNNLSDLIAVTGATGQLGRLVVRHLADLGAPMRLLVRDPARAPQIADAEVVAAEYEHPLTLRAALDGVKTVFLVSAHEAADRMDLHRSVVATIAEAGVERVVYTSFLGAAPKASFSFARDHALTERAIREAGLQLTALRDGMYGEYAPLLVQDGVIRGPAADGRVAWVAREDIARVAATVLTTDGHEGQIYDVTGPEAITLAETAEVLAEVSGRPVRYEPETIEQARASRSYAEDWEIDGWVGTYVGIATGEMGVTSHSVELLTGRRPWTLRELLHAEPELIAPLTKDA
jgi:NAD(P)H dehydrogenase (quinone)